MGSGDIISSVIDKFASGGPAAGWLLAVYLLARIHQLTDRQHKANIDTIRVLTIIKTVLYAREGNLRNGGTND